MVDCIYKLSEELIESIKTDIDSFLYGSIDELIKDVNEKNPDAIFVLSIIGQIGGCSEDEWMFFLNEAADLGCEEAIKQLADFYDSDETLYNPDKAIELYKKIAPKGNIRANYQLGIYYALNDKIDEAIKCMEFVGENSAGDINDYVANFFETIEDYNRAIKYYKTYRVYEDPEYDLYLKGYEPDKEGVLECVYGNIAYCYYQLKDFSNASIFINKGIVINDSYCMFLKGLIYYENEDNNGEEQIDKAIEWFIKASNANSKNASLYLGKIYSNDDKYFDREKALYYFGKAEEFANSCKPLIEALSLGSNLSKEDRFLRYIDNIIEEKVDVSIYPEIVLNDLKKDFGNYWNKLSDFTKDVMITGITTFMTYKNIEHSNPSIKLDYSPVIISISRGLERELRNVFFDKFKKYLNQINADPYNFRRLRDFTYVDKSGNYQFNDNNHWFTLGKLKIMVNGHLCRDYYGKSFITMDKYLRDYCMNFVFKKSQFSFDEWKHKNEVTEYMCDLSRNVSEISDLFRNESAHTNSTSSQDRATVCINWIIKVRQLLLRFLEKLDYDSLESL